MPRLDETLVSCGKSPSRSRARDQITRGCVTVNGKPARKVSQNVGPGDAIEVDDRDRKFVSRAAHKLAHGIDHFKLSPAGCDCLDAGASTGGFTQVLLERGAAHVTAIDVGHGQMAGVIASDPRVTVLEGVNARDYPPSPGTGFITCDVSFISLKLALAGILDAVKPGCILIALIKPQFEVGRERLPKDGVVKDPDLHQAVCGDISRFLESGGWAVAGIIPSPITGGDGNKEFLIAATKT